MTCIAIYSDIYCPFCLCFQDHPANPDLSDHEIFTIAREVERLGKINELAEALEMSDDDATILLQRWRKEMTSLNTPTRKDLLYHLTNIDGLEHLVKRLVIVARRL